MQIFLRNHLSFFFLNPSSRAAVSPLKLFNILTGCCLALQMTPGKRNKESMDTLLCLLPLGVCCMEEAGLHLYDKGFFLELIFS